MTRSLIIGTRGSKLALWQAEHVRERLLSINAELDVQVRIIKTTGDVNTNPLSVIGGKGVFTKELEDALLQGRVDLAVHSLKDLPTFIPDGLTIGAICQREDPRDALVLRSDLRCSSVSLWTLPECAVVGTSSQRRLAQLRALRSDLVVKDLRGNVDTRLRKLDEGQYDALILASAGLLRLGLHERVSAAIPTTEMLPAVGQGAIAIETRSDDEFAIEAARKLDHAETRSVCVAERALLRTLGGGCQFPIAGHAVIVENGLRLEGLVAKPDGSQVVRDWATGAVEAAEEIGAQLGTQMLARGATQLLHGH